MMHSFSIRAAAEPQALARVIDQFARQWVTPIRMDADRLGDELLITIRLCDLSPEKADIIAATLSSCPLVHGVELEPGAGAGPVLALVHP